MNDKENELYEKYDPDKPYDPTKAYNIYLKNFKEALKKNGETTKEINEKVIDFKLLFLGFLLHVVSVNLTKGNVKIIDSEGNELKKILTLYEKSSDSTKKSSKFSPIKYSNTLQLIFKELSDDGSIPFTLADFCYSPKEIKELFPEESKQKAERLFSDKKWSDFDILTYNTSIQKLPFRRPSKNRSFISMITEIFESLFAKKILGTNSSADPIFYMQLPTGKFFDASLNKNRLPFSIDEKFLIYYDYPVSMIGQLLFHIRRSWYSPLTLTLETKDKKTKISLYDTIILFEDFYKSKLNVEESSADSLVKPLSKQDNILLEKIKNDSKILASIFKNDELKKMDLFVNATETPSDDSTKADLTDDIKTSPEKKPEYSPEKIFSAITANNFPGTKSNTPNPLLLKYQHILLLLSSIDKLDNYLRILDSEESPLENFINYSYPIDSLTVSIFIVMELWFMEGTQKNIYKYLVQNHIKSENISRYYDPNSINQVPHPFINVKSRRTFHKSVIDLLSIGKTDLDKETKEKIKQEADKLFPPKGDSKSSANEYSVPYSYAKTLNGYCRDCKYVVTPAKDSIETERCSLKLGCLECEHNEHLFNSLSHLLPFK